MIKVNRFKVKINDTELIDEINTCIYTLKKLRICPYVSRVAKNIGLKEYELQQIIVDLKLSVCTGSSSGKLIFTIASQESKERCIIFFKYKNKKLCCGNCKHHDLITPFCHSKDGVIENPDLQHAPCNFYEKGL